MFWGNMVMKLVKYWRIVAGRWGLMVMLVIGFHDEHWQKVLKKYGELSLSLDAKRMDDTYPDLA